MKFIINRSQFVKETEKKIDGNEFLVAYDVPIAKTGIQQYTREEVGDNNGRPDEMVNVFRDPDTFKDEEVIESFDGIPIVYAHPDNGKVDDSNFKNYIVGTVSGVYSKSGNLYAKKLTIIDREAIKNVLSKNTNELSIGFRGSIEKRKGTFNGTPYEFKEQVLHANHLALCENGKAGPFFAINSLKVRNKKNMNLLNEEKKLPEEDCMNADGPDIPLSKNIAAHIEQVVKQKLAGVKPFLKDDNYEMGEPSVENESKEEEKEMKLNESDPELEKSEHKDKDVINALKNSNKKLRMLLDQRNNEINKLEVHNINLESALTEARDYMKDMAARLQSKNLVNAMTGPDEMVLPQSQFLKRDAQGLFSKALTNLMK